MTRVLLAFSLLLCLALTSCFMPRSIEVPDLTPEPYITKYGAVLDNFGRLLETYRDSVIYVMSQDIVDATGVSTATGGEIPYNITEMVRSALNSIGDRVVYVPHDPALIVNEMHLGASFKRPNPTVLLSAALTEYDRTVESEGSSLDLQSSFGGGITETDIGADMKESYSVSRITVDMNLIDYKRMVMIPKMQSINSVRVYNFTGSNSLSFAINGNGLGISGQIKRINGRHAAVRLLAELSVLEIVGRYASVPYWRCLPEGKEDPVVVEKLHRFFAKLDQAGRIKAVQQLLPYYGHPGVTLTGKLDPPTLNALAAEARKFQGKVSKDDLAGTYKILYLNLPYGKNG